MRASETADGRSIALPLSSVIGNLQDRTDTYIREARWPSLAFYLYGVLYILVALPCVANVMAAPLLVAATTKGWLARSLSKHSFCSPWLC